jgi:hypothetical protein
MPSLLGIPSKIRTIILKDAITFEPIKICFQKSDYNCSMYYRKSYPTIENPNINLLLVCRQITAEAKSLKTEPTTLNYCSFYCAYYHVEEKPTFIRDQQVTLNMPFAHSNYETRLAKWEESL